MRKRFPAWNVACVLAALAQTGCDDDEAPSCTGTVEACLPGGDAGHDASMDSLDAATSDASTGEDGSVDAGPAEPPCSAAAAPDLTGLVVESVVSNLDNLVYAAQPKGSSDWYLVEQAGTVKVRKAGDGNTTSVFLNLPEANNSGGGDERGLLSITFPPDYATSGLFYVMLTPTSGSLAQHDVVLEYQRSAADPYVADVATRKVILDVPSSAGNHNGGTAIFGPDGLLYVGTGDGGGACNDNKPDTPQDIDSLYGKVLRLDPSKAEPYAADGNPFASSGDARVLHYGLRNPFRMGFDRVTGDLYLGDVGQGAYEEIDFAPASAKGFNFGWGAFEGSVAATSLSNAQWCNAPSAARPMLRAGSQHTPPIVSLDRRSSGCNGDFCDYSSVIAGPVYRGTGLTKLRGAFLFGDYVGARMGALYQCGQQTSPVAVLRKRCNSSDEACLPMSAGLDELTAIVEGADNEIYLVASRDRLLKLVEAP